MTENTMGLRKSPLLAMPRKKLAGCSSTPLTVPKKLCRGLPRLNSSAEAPPDTRGGGGTPAPPEDPPAPGSPLDPALNPTRISSHFDVRITYPLTGFDGLEHRLR